MVKCEFALTHLWSLASYSCSPFGLWFRPKEVVSWLVVRSLRGGFQSIF